MSLPRAIVPGRRYMITRRCSERRFFMRPDRETNNAFIYCLALAARKASVSIVCVGTLSNRNQAGPLLRPRKRRPTRCHRPALPARARLRAPEPRRILQAPARQGCRGRRESRCRAPGEGNQAPRPQGRPTTALELASGHTRASPWNLAARGVKEYLGAGRGPAAQSGLHRPVPRSPRRPPGWPRGHLPRRHLVVASFRRREVRRAGRHRPAELTNGSSRLLPRRLARDDGCPQRGNVATLTSAVRRETAGSARADVISGLSPGRSGSATPRYRGQHRCGAIGAALSTPVRRYPHWMRDLIV